MKNLVIPSIILGMSIVVAGVLLKPLTKESLPSRYTMHCSGDNGAIVIVMDSFTGRVSSRTLTSGSSYNKVLFPAPIPIADESISDKQVREWRIQGYTDGQIFDTIAIKHPKFVEAWKEGFSEAELVEEFIRNSSSFSEKQR
jgi:hypothetical protein